MARGFRGFRRNKDDDAGGTLWLYDRDDSSHNVSWSPTVPWYRLAAVEYHPQSYNIYSEYVRRKGQKILYVKGSFYAEVPYGSSSQYSISIEHDGTSQTIASGSYGSSQGGTKTINAQLDISGISEFRIRVYLYAKSGSTGNDAVANIMLTEVYAE